MPFYYGFDYSYLVLILPAMLIAMWAQFNVKNTYAKYSKVYSSRGYTGAQVARKILDENQLYSVKIERIGGNLTDHFDPKSNIVRLSDGVYNSCSVASIGVAAHEVGHAIQHATGYTPIKIRSAIVPICNIGSTLSMPLILIGFLMSFEPLVLVGIALFSLVTVFQLVTLPVEFNASSRALKTIEASYILQGEEVKSASKVLKAAALTYVAALIVSFMQLLRLVLLFNRRRD